MNIIVKTGAEAVRTTFAEFAAANADGFDIADLAGVEFDLTTKGVADLSEFMHTGAPCTLEVA